MFRMWDTKNKKWLSNSLDYDYVITQEGKVDCYGGIDWINRSKDGSHRESSEVNHFRDEPTIIFQNTLKKDRNGNYIYSQYGENAVHGDVVEIPPLNEMWVVCWNVSACSWQLRGNSLLFGHLSTLQSNDITIIGNTCELEGLPDDVRPMVEKYLKEASREVE